MTKIEAVTYIFSRAQYIIIFILFTVGVGLAYHGDRRGKQILESYNQLLEIGKQQIVTQEHLVNTWEGLMRRIDIHEENNRILRALATKMDVLYPEHLQPVPGSPK